MAVVLKNLVSLENNMSNESPWLSKLNSLCARGFKISASVDNRPPEIVDTSESIVNQNDVNNFLLTVSGHTGAGVRKCILTLSLPKFTKNGIFEMNGVKRAIVQRISLDYSNITSSERLYVVDNWLKVLRFNLSNIISSKLENFYHHGTIPPENLIQDKVDNFLKTDHMCQRIDSDHIEGIVESSIPETIYFKDIIDNGLDVDSRKFPRSLRGLVDYASTGAGDNINKSYRLVKGTKIDSKGKLVRNDQGNMFCSTIQNNAIGIQYNPDRVHLLRAQYEQALRIENTEIPYIRAKNNMLQGMHFNTAIMNFGHSTYEDAITFSESAAARFRAIKKHYVRLNTSNDVTPVVFIGQVVNNNTPILKQTSNIESEDNKYEKFEYCKNLTFNGKVVSIDVFNSRHYGKDTKKTVVEIEECLPLNPGDKITTRGGIKGVAVICPDNQMPHFKNNDEFVPIDVCISVKSIYNRKSVATIWEMAANRYVIDNQITDLISEPFNEPFTYEELMDKGCGASTQLYIKKKPLKHETYVNPLFIMRNDKLASDTLTYNGDKQEVTENGFPVGDSARAGQKLSLANKENIRFKDLPNIAAEFSKSIKGREYISRLVNALKDNNDN